MRGPDSARRRSERARFVYKSRRRIARGTRDGGITDVRVDRVRDALVRRLDLDDALAVDHSPAPPAAAAVDAILKHAQITRACRAVLALADTKTVGDELVHRAADVLLELRKRLISCDAVLARVDLSLLKLGIAPRCVDATSFAGAGTRRRPGRGRGLIRAVRELGAGRRCAVRAQRRAVLLSEAALARVLRIIVIGIVNDACDARTRARADRGRKQIERLWLIAERHVSLALALAAAGSAPEQSVEQAEHHCAAP